MNILLTNAFGFQKEMPLANKTVEIAGYAAKMRISDIEVSGSLCVFINGQPCEPDNAPGNEENAFVYSCWFNQKDVCVFEIASTGRRVCYTLYNTASLGQDYFETALQLGEFARQYRNVFQNRLMSLNKLFSCLKRGTIKIFHTVNPLSNQTDKAIIEEVNKALPSAQAICSHPQQSLKVDERLLEVERIKRTSPYSLRHLGAHSEHWKARSLAGLIPLRMIAQTHEDDVDIYENLFFKRAMTATQAIVRKAYRRLEKFKRQRSDWDIWQTYSDSFRNYEETKLLRDLVSGLDVEDEEMFKDYEKELRKIVQKLTAVTSSSFYQQIDGCRAKRLPLPIHPTNILKMEPHYHAIFNLWKKLQNKEEQEIVSGMDKYIRFADRNYFLYVSVLLVYGLHREGYELLPGDGIHLDADAKLSLSAAFLTPYALIQCSAITHDGIGRIEITLTEKRIFKMHYDLDYDIGRLAMELEGFKVRADGESCLLFDCEYEKLQDKALDNHFKDRIAKIMDKQEKSRVKNLDRRWRKRLEEFRREQQSIIPRMAKISIVPILGGTGEGNEAVAANTSAILSNPQEENGSTIFVLPYDFLKIGHTLPPNLVQRLLNYGESYGEKEEAERWGGYQEGMLPISQTDLLSISRLVKAVKMHLTLMLLEGDSVTTSCPNCGSNNVRQSGKNWQCNDCGVQWGKTKCSSKNGCAREYPWIRPSKRVERKKVEGTDDVEKAKMKEFLFGSWTVTDFDLADYDAETMKYNPRCPYCGHVKS